MDIGPPSSQGVIFKHFTRTKIDIHLLQLGSQAQGQDYQFPNSLSLSFSLEILKQPVTEQKELGGCGWCYLLIPSTNILHA